MYTVLMDGVAIHDPSLNNSAHLIMDGVVMKQVNKADSFSFVIYPDNVGYSALELMTSWISVYKDGSLIFHGRPLTEETGWDNEKKIVCEGDLAILNDTVVRPYSFSGTLGDYVRMIVNQHNAQVEAAKQIAVRRIDLSTTSIIRRTGEYKSTMQELFEKVVDYFGGYILMEYESGQIYISYLTDSTSGTNQVLEIGKNILSFNRSISSEALATALIPLGATDDSTGERLTIKSVNGGSDYIASSEAATQGYYYAAYTFDDITDPSELLAKARALLTDLVRVSPRIELSAVDLSDAGYDIDSIGFFQYVTVQDTAHTVSGQYLITERVYNISAPEKDSVTFGSEEKTISGQTAKTQISVSSMTDAFINKAVEIVTYQTDLLKGGSGGYFVIGTDTDGHPSEIYFLDTNSTATARSVLRINSAGIGFSTTGFAGPYTNAWTIDGQLHADFIKTGVLSDQQGKNSWNLDTGEFHSQTLETSISANATAIQSEVTRATAAEGALSASVAQTAGQVSIVAEKLNNIGGRNILLDSLSPDPWTTYSGATATFTTGVSVPEWGATDAIRVVGTTANEASKETILRSNVSQTPATMIQGQKYAASMWLKNQGSTRMYFQINGGNSQDVDPGESKRVEAHADGNGVTYIQISVRCRQASVPYDIVIWHPQVEYGEVVTSWTPAPEDIEGEMTNVRNEVTVNTEGITLLSSKVNNIGGRNYLQYSNDRSTWRRNFPTSYQPAEIALYSNMVGGKQYTVTIWGDVPTRDGADGYYSVYWGGGYTTLANVHISNGKGSATFTAPTSGARIGNAWINIYNTADGGGSSHTFTSNITAVKLEEGEVSTDWSAAPEDKTGNNEIIAKINLSPEAITISASKVDLHGYVTFTNLSTSGQTAIDGGNITTGTISADRIGANSITAAKINLTDLFSQNITATNFNLTGGSINITTSAQTTDVIQLNYSGSHVLINPVRIEVGASSSGGMFGDYSCVMNCIMGSIAVYDPIGSAGNYFNVTAHTGLLSLKGASTPGTIDIKSNTGNTTASLSGGNGYGTAKETALVFLDDSSTAGRPYRMALTNDGLTFRDSSNNVTASYPATGLMSIGKAFYNANTDRTVLSNRTAAILANVVRTDFEGFKGFSVRYSGGYYYSYFVINPSKVQGGMVILEVSPYGNGEISIFTIDGNNTITLKRTI